ncbi:V4R domain-containing protein [Synechococcus sp. C9]|uniref:V4R domain-containing protein n=1 Tax=Synechococcus sp. C9 TaxID=102119 RepID=UPI001FF65CC8|nr:V4R domain-containing protein [Synechococcus sp. C9]
MPGMPGKGTVLTTADWLENPTPTPVAPKDNKHNHYDLTTFFHWDLAQGKVTDWNGAVNFFASEDLITGLLDGLTEEVGEAAPVVMYQIGRQWGTFDGHAFDQWFTAEFQRSVRQSNLLFLLETWWWPFTAQGWGRWEVDLSLQKQNILLVNIFDSAIARTLGVVGKPVCHLYAGLFAGFLSHLVQRTLECAEIQCYSMGATYCRFVVGKAPVIQQVNQWVSQGLSVRDIEQKLAGGQAVWATT